MHEMQLSGMLVAIDYMLGRKVNMELPQEVELAVNSDVAKTQVTNSIQFIFHLQGMAIVFDYELAHWMVLGNAQEVVLLVSILDERIFRIMLMGDCF